MNNYNFTATACLFFNEIKTITPKKGNPYIAIKGCILEGDQESPNYETIDLIVSGKEAKTILQSLENDWNDKKFFASARIGSLSTKAFLKKNGEPGAVLSGRLLKISYLKVADVVIVSSEKDEVSKEETSKDSSLDRKATYKLEKNDDNFDEKLSWLKRNGYQWDKENQQWFDPEMIVA